MQYAIENEDNIVIPKIGYDSKNIEKLVRLLNACGYKVHLILVRLDRKKAVQRAFFRYIKTGRYVPLPLIFDVYGNDPTINFYDFVLSREIFESFTMFSSDVPIGTPNIKVFTKGNSPFV